MRISLKAASKQASVLVIVLWISFGLVAMALYFGQSMLFELRAADNRVANIEADQAIAGAICYVSNVLATALVPGTLPDTSTYRCEAVPVGDAAFWLIGRSDADGRPDQLYYSLVDESSKLNLNSVTPDMLLYLPRMTSDLAAAIQDWRDTDSDVTQGGAEDELYQRLNPPRRCKNANFESVDELRLVYGMDLEVLYGEDANMNGILDLNENDADQSPPTDNHDGRLDPGLIEYFTVFSKQPTTRTNGSARVNVSSTNSQDLASLLTEKFDSDRADQIMTQLGYTSGQVGGSGRGNQPGGSTGGQSGQSGQGGAGGAGRPTGGAGATVTPTFGSVLEFYIRSGMSASDFAQIESDLTASATNGLVNVNTARQAVLEAIPGIGVENASSLISYRKNNRTSLALNPTLTWVADLLASTNAIQAGPYITGQSYQFTADIAAVGHYGRGYRRARVVFDTSQGTPRVVSREDLTGLGWALGAEVRRSLLLLAQNKR